MWGNEVLLLLLEKTLRFETIAEVSFKNLTLIGMSYESKKNAHL